MNTGRGEGRVGRSESGVGMNSRGREGRIDRR